MTSTPHDALFKATFSQPEHAAAALAAALPPELAAHIDFSALQLEPGSFVDQSLAASHSDLLFTAPLAGEPVLIYILYEHQSDAQPLMVFRLLRYMVRVWDRYIEHHPGARSLPAILPVVLHHSESGWRVPTSFQEILDLSPAARAVMAEHVPRFRFVLDDISHETDEGLRNRARMTALGRVVLWCLRYARAPWELLERLPGWREVVHEARQGPGGRAATVRVWRYILKVTDPTQPEVFLRELLAQAGSEAKEEIVSVEDWLREQGRKEGLREADRRTLLKQLQLRFGELPEAVVGAVRAAAPEQLERWLERVVTANALSEVLAES